MGRLEAVASGGPIFLLHCLRITFATRSFLARRLVGRPGRLPPIPIGRIGESAQVRRLNAGAAVGLRAEHGIQHAGGQQAYPLQLKIGVPKVTSLTIEYLEKQF